MTTNIPLSGTRLWDSLMEIAKFGGTAKGGCNRQTLTGLDGEGRALLPCLETSSAGVMFARGPPDGDGLAEVIARTQAFQAEGADMILAPGMAEPDEIATLCRSVDIPVAAIVGLSHFQPVLPEFGHLRVRRVIVGNAFARVAMAGVLAAAREVASQGTFRFADGPMSFEEFNDLFRRPGA